MAVKHIKINGTSYDINDSRSVVIGNNAYNLVALTTAQYNALATKDPETLYVITDGDPGDGSSVSWGTESGYTVPLTINGTTKTVCLNGYSAGGSGGGGDINEQITTSLVYAIYDTEHSESFDDITQYDTSTIYNDITSIIVDDGKVPMLRVEDHAGADPSVYLYYEGKQSNRYVFSEKYPGGHKVEISSDNSMATSIVDDIIVVEGILGSYAGNDPKFIRDYGGTLYAIGPDNSNGDEDYTLAVTSQLPTESTVAGWGFTKNTGTYSKPSGGIPATDLASAVQTSLGKADTALQSYTETDPIFLASAAHGISSTDISNWNSKQSAITISSSEPTSSQGSNGDIWIVV